MTVVTSRNGARFARRCWTLGLAAILACWGGAAASAAELTYPLSLAAADDGSLYVGDLDLPGVWKLKDGSLSLLFHASKQFRTPLNRVRCLAIDKDGKLLAGDTPTRQVYRFDDKHQPIGLVPGAGIGMPMALAVHQDGTIYVADLELHAIWKLPSAGGEPVKFAEINAPRGLAFDKEGHLWVVSGQPAGPQLLRYSPDGKATHVTENTVFRFPHNVVVDDKLTAYVTDGYERCVWRVPLGGKPEKWVSSDAFAEQPAALAKRGDKLYVGVARAQAIYEIDAAGKATRLEWKVDPAAAAAKPPAIEVKKPAVEPKKTDGEKPAAEK